MLLGLLSRFLREYHFAAILSLTNASSAADGYGWLFDAFAKFLCLGEELGAVDCTEIIDSVGGAATNATPASASQGGCTDCSLPDVSGGNGSGCSDCRPESAEASGGECRNEDAN